MNAKESSIPCRINTGTFVSAYSRAELQDRIQDARIVLPVCSLGTPPARLASLGEWVLPPLYHQAMTAELKEQLIQQIRRCFPYYEGSSARAHWAGRLDVVELPPAPPPPCPPPRVLAFSVDPAIEQHGPHLPLATDTIQSYAVLEQIGAEVPGFVVAPPVDYGQLTWGLPFGFSIDVTAPLITHYVAGFVNAVMEWQAPEALYVVDVHGSLVHRGAVQAGLKASRCPRHLFRWLYDPLTEFASARGDMHAGGVETAVLHAISLTLVDSSWWPGRLPDLAAGQLPVQTVIDLSGNMERFVQQIESHPANGIVGDIRNFYRVDGAALLERMVGVARTDVSQLLGN